VGGGPHIITLAAPATLYLAANDCLTPSRDGLYFGDNSGELTVTIARAPAGSLCFDGSTLGGWTFPLSTPTVNTGSGNPAPSLQTSSGQRAYREITGLGPGWEITADMLVNGGGPVNLGLLASTAGAGQFFRLDTRGSSTAPVGFAAMQSWTSWNSPPGEIQDSGLTDDRWHAVRIEIGETIATGYIDGIQLHTYTYNNSGEVVALHGDSGGGGQFDNVCVRPAGAPGGGEPTPVAQPLSYWKSAALSSPPLPITLGTYNVDTQAEARGVFKASNCGVGLGDAVGCLAGQLLVAKLNFTAEVASDCIATTAANADTFLTTPPTGTVNYTGPGSYTLTKSQRRTALIMVNALETFNTSGCP
jgi:hypothetical protein